MVLVGAIYPMFTFGDAPERWTGEGPGAAALRDSTETRTKELWLIVERDAPLGNWFLGERQSALDLYLARDDAVAAAAGIFSGRGRRRSPRSSNASTRWMIPSGLAAALRRVSAFRT